MTYRYQPPGPGIRIGGPLTPVVQALLLATALGFVVQQLVTGWLGDPRAVFEYLGLTPERALLGLRPWQFVTYMFLHGGLGHLLLNLLALWMFGGDVEKALGRREFLRYYFVCGIGAGLTQAVFAFRGTTVGASGAIFGILLAFAYFYPDRQILLWLIVPMRARQFVVIYGVLELLMLVSPSRQWDNVAHAAHLGGLVFGYLYLKRAWNFRDFSREMRWRFRRRRFKVLRRDEDGDDRRYPFH